MSRTDDRKGFDDLTRLILLEKDLDVLEQLLVRQNAKLDRIFGIVLAILVAVTTSSIMLVIR